MGMVLRRRAAKKMFAGVCGRRYGTAWDEYNMFAGLAEETNRIRITGYSETGFETTDKGNHEGPIICLNKFTLCWTPQTFEEITPDSLSLFQLLRPAPEILVLGCGSKIRYISNELRQFIRSNGMKVEAVDSRNAASTFNFLNDEGRLVAAAMLPYGIP